MNNSTKFYKRLFLIKPESYFLTKVRRINWLYVVLIFLLASIGYITLYSVTGGISSHFATPQAIRFAVGVVVMITTALLPQHIIKAIAAPLYILSILLLVAVLFKGHVGKGAERWLIICGVQIQPSEFAKIALILALSKWFSRIDYKQIGNPLWLIPPATMVILPVLLILKEPNLGTAVIIGGIGASLFFVSGMRLWLIALLLLPTPALLQFGYAHLHDYQRARIKTFLHPNNDPLGAGYNIIQSKIALGSGGMWGQGYMNGSQVQLNFLPEKQTDFIFTVIAEEWGFIGAITVISLLLLIILGGMIIAILCRNQFSRLLALGISMNFFFYCLVNLSMVMGLIPVGGVPLPLVSYGGSSLLAVMFGFGLLMSAWIHRYTDYE
ncbi:MAG: rod shape-determining protein RodA [Acetobacter sp.]|nr:rod shape-determining protein RodA [Acetobacter sp.]